jgi:hypothetical protein
MVNEADPFLVLLLEQIHLFVVPGVSMDESKTTLAGDVLHDPVQTAVGKGCVSFLLSFPPPHFADSLSIDSVGLLTCYDLRFPEVAIMLRRKGAEIIAYPSAFTSSTGPPHWDVLLRARAIETQSYVIAAAQVRTLSLHFPSQPFLTVLSPVSRSAKMLPVDARTVTP